jgi:hypothetical protein
MIPPKSWVALTLTVSSALLFLPNRTQRIRGGCDDVVRKAADVGAQAVSARESFTATYVQNFRIILGKYLNVKPTSHILFTQGPRKPARRRMAGAIRSSQNLEPSPVSHKQGNGMCHKHIVNPADDDQLA